MRSERRWGTQSGTHLPGGETTKVPTVAGAGLLTWVAVVLLGGALGGTRAPNLLIRSQML
jgi:hypothetical protein